MQVNTYLATYVRFDDDSGRERKDVVACSVLMIELTNLDRNAESVAASFQGNDRSSSLALGAQNSRSVLIGKLVGHVRSWHLGL